MPFASNGLQGSEAVLNWLKYSRSLRIQKSLHIDMLYMKKSHYFECIRKAWHFVFFIIILLRNYISKVYYPYWFLIEILDFYDRNTSHFYHNNHCYKIITGEFFLEWYSYFNWFKNQYFYNTTLNIIRIR